MNNTEVFSQSLEFLYVLNVLQEKMTLSFDLLQSFVVFFQYFVIPCNLKKYILHLEQIIETE